MLGVCYVGGAGVQHDMTEAIKWLHRAGMRYNNWRKRDQGSGSKSFTIAELRQGQSLTLASKDDPTVRHTLILKAEGFPAEPE